MKKIVSRRSPQELLKRYIAFAIALFIIALGTSLSIRANLGSSPISCPPYVLSRIPGIRYTMGEFVFCMHVFFVLSQYALLRKQFDKIQFLQLAVSLIFGIYTDVTMWLTGFVQFDSSWLGYLLRWIQLAVGGSLLAYGIAIEVHCDVLMLAGEGFPLAISKATKTDFGKVKICSDTGLVIVGIIFCYMFFGQWRWNLIGVGTLFSTFFVGFMVRNFNPHFAWLNNIFTSSKQQPIVSPQTETIEESHPLIITISRQYGSGGHEIGEKLASTLHCKLYDKNIIDTTAKELGCTYDYIKEKEQNISNMRLLELILTDKILPSSMYLSQDDAIFVSQSRTIKQIVKKENCVIIGRCADWLLRSTPNCFRIFVHSDIEFACKRVAKERSVSELEAKSIILQTNKQRANHYWQYTGEKWNDSLHYDLVINTSKIEIDKAVELIQKMVKNIASNFTF